ncbi:MAG: hypothetical protein EZS28_030585 [Streblomastix strix]|uniref:Uncharacterized protein n=1 Tax=Streblomastix strix TaxID=222440 RepID=A0A5J4UU05_9EUKA|nr:MAG: hypothetical protein EZS28_030585 [Streblomastix strix]
MKRIVADGSNINLDEDQSEHTIEPKCFINGNDGLRRNDSGKQQQVTVNGESNPEINTTKTSANTPSHNVNGSNGHGGNGCGTQLQAASNENGNSNHQAFNCSSGVNDNEQPNANRTEGNVNQLRLINVDQHEQGTKYRNYGNFKLKRT